MYEANENFFVNLSEPVNVSFADAQGTGTINNDDSIPTISVIGSFGPEGDSGVTNINVTLQLTNPTSLPVTLNLLTSDGTAVGNQDYVPSDTPLTIPPATQSFTAQVQVRGDVINEPNETFFVNVYNVANATVTQPQSQVTIVDDDPGVIDFEGDGKTDIGIFRPSTGQWWYRRSLDSLVRVFTFGTGTDKIVPGITPATEERISLCGDHLPVSGSYYVPRTQLTTRFHSAPTATFHLRGITITTGERTMPCSDLQPRHGSFLSRRAEPGSSSLG
jgi:hypothetical protein